VDRKWKEGKGEHVQKIEGKTELYDPTPPKKDANLKDREEKASWSFLKKSG